MTKAKSRLKKRPLKERLQAPLLLILTIILGLLLISYGRKLETQNVWNSIEAEAYQGLVVKEIEVEVPKQNASDYENMMFYLIEKFGEDSDEAISIIRTCENKSFDPSLVSQLNIQKSGRRSYDVGLMQINVNETDLDELERLKDWKYNIDQGFKKYKASGDTFYQWSCAGAIGQKSFAN
jgi:hypothetical protein